MYTKPYGTPNTTRQSQMSKRVVTGIVALIVGAWFVRTWDVTTTLKRIFTHPFSYISTSAEARWKYDQGMDYLEDKDWLNAVRSFTESIQLVDDNAEVYYQRGYAYHQQMRLGLSMADIQWALHLDPNHALAYYERGWLQNQRGDTEAALRDLSKSIELKPDHFDSYVGRGTLHFKRSEWHEVIDDITNAIAYMPDLKAEEESGFYEMRGVAYFSTDQINEGVDDFNLAMNIWPLAYHSLHTHLTELNADLNKPEPGSDTYVKLEKLIARIKHE